MVERAAPRGGGGSRADARVCGSADAWRSGCTSRARAGCMRDRRRTPSRTPRREAPGVLTRLARTRRSRRRHLHRRALPPPVVTPSHSPGRNEPLNASSPLSARLARPRACLRLARHLVAHSTSGVPSQAVRKARCKPLHAPAPHSARLAHPCTCTWWSRHRHFVAHSVSVHPCRRPSATDAASTPRRDCSTTTRRATLRAYASCSSARRARTQAPCSVARRQRVGLRAN